MDATYTETPAYKGSVNDGRVLETAVVPPNHWTNYRKMPQTQSSDSLIYQWNGAVRVNGSKVWFDTDANALRAPASWKLQYLDADGSWKVVPNSSEYGVDTGKNAPNEVTFDAVTTTALKLDMTAQAVDGGYASVGVPEWEVYAQQGAVVAEQPADVYAKTGDAPELSNTVKKSRTARKQWKLRFCGARCLLLRMRRRVSSPCKVWLLALKPSSRLMI